jgi:hypothetical protein
LRNEALKKMAFGLLPPPENKNIIFNKISKFRPKKSEACKKMPQKWGVKIKLLI